MNDITETKRIEQDKLVVCRSQDVSGYLERNRRERAEFRRRLNSSMRKVAEIPLIVIEQWMKEGINIFDRNDAKKVQQKLNSPEYAYLRTSPGKCVVK